MKEIHAPIMSEIIPIVLGCLDAGRSQFGIASVAAANISPDQTEMHIHLSSERDTEGACRFAKRCVREVVDVLKKSKLLRNVPYVSFKPAVQDQAPRLHQLIHEAHLQIEQAKIREEAVLKVSPKPVLEAKTTTFSAPQKTPAPKKISPKKVVVKKVAVKVVAKKVVAKKSSSATVVAKKSITKKAPVKTSASSTKKSSAKKPSPRQKSSASKVVSRTKKTPIATVKKSRKKTSSLASRRA